MKYLEHNTLPWWFSIVLFWLFSKLMFEICLFLLNFEFHFQGRRATLRANFWLSNCGLSQFFCRKGYPKFSYLSYVWSPLSPRKAVKSTKMHQTIESLNLLKSFCKAIRLIYLFESQGQKEMNKTFWENFEFFSNERYRCFFLIKKKKKKHYVPVNVAL